MAAVTIIRLPLGPFQVNTYIVICHQRGQAIIIDPAADPQTIIDTLDAQGAVASRILNTHGHPDHLLANAALRRALDIPVYMHAADSGLFADDPGIRLLEQQTGLTVDTIADRPLNDGQILRLGATPLEVLHTPGHTPGGCCFLVDGQLFTGDTLFVGDAGRTDLEGGSLDQLIHSIETRLLPLPDTTVIWPGHDYGTTPTSTLAREKQENPYITDFILNP
ncbi:Beta-lactamase domain protein [Desulfosarcina cetonica]|uniref:MBL fold metallo-hydrolase n=1 Tax=Desulfosarcina cetonica TaxID=90730 RepID=UPI0006CFC687|nr:MBL fold metallo-hydrolase [Desulfosarcina cetonica]VTR63926.1 Beta-lactamase domain protein [Desulfosarcina cetonica]